MLITVFDKASCSYCLTVVDIINKNIDNLRKAEDEGLSFLY